MSNLVMRMRLSLTVVTLVASCGAATGEVDTSQTKTGGKGGSGGAYMVDFGSSGSLGGTSGGGVGNIGTGTEGNACGQLVATIRDFSDQHADFEKLPYVTGKVELGLVKPTLDKDKKPVYAFDKATFITSQDTFSQWYRDVNGVNQKFSVTLQMQETSPGIFVYDNDLFFPIEDKGFGNQGRNHNFHFTTEIRGGFAYKGGEKFSFKGDDDVWVFVNGKLAIDIGGIHGKETATIDFDAKAQELGITKGKTYSLDVFHAERHITESHFRMETSIQCLSVPVL
jgi:fibro-slime domain-containing protein